MQGQVYGSEWPSAMGLCQTSGRSYPLARRMQNTPYNVARHERHVNIFSTSHRFWRRDVVGSLDRFLTPASRRLVSSPRKNEGANSSPVSRHPLVALISEEQNRLVLIPEFCRTYEVAAISGPFPNTYTKARYLEGRLARSQTFAGRLQHRGIWMLDFRLLVAHVLTGCPSTSRMCTYKALRNVVGIL